MLSIVSTPIGNLGDITRRACNALQSCDAIICEDTRVTGKLLQLLELPKKELISFHSHSDEAKIRLIMDRLEQGQHLVLVSDAGTPGISDPGYAIVSEAARRGRDIDVIPGPSAFLTALSISGLPINQFVYLGFLPTKRGRKALIASFADEERTIVFYESPHRILKTLQELSAALSDQPQRPIVICRELTKLHQEVVRTTIAELASVRTSLKVKGEFVVVLGI